jgi:hypothetical protein
MMRTIRCPGYECNVCPLLCINEEMVLFGSSEDSGSCTGRTRAAHGRFRMFGEDLPDTGCRRQIVDDWHPQAQDVGLDYKRHTPCVYENLEFSHRINSPLIASQIEGARRGRRAVVEQLKFPRSPMSWE